MRYEDFDLHFQTAGADRFIARVISSPAGQGDTTFVLPSGMESLRIRGRLGHAGHRATAREIDEGEYRSASADPLLAAREIGQALFQSLFSQSIASLFQTSLSYAVGGEDGGGLRIRLHFTDSDPALMALSALPWELLYHDGFLAQSRNTPVVRCLDLATAETSRRLERPLSILAVAPRPPKTRPLALQEEIKDLQATWTRVPDQVLRVLVAPTVQELRRALLEREVQILHFMGHGGVRRQGGVLLFEDLRGGTDPVTAERFTAFLRDRASLRLVTLNACDTASLPAGPASDPTAAVAGALMRVGVPVVIAMQLPISDLAAITFSTTFFERLAAGDPPEAALVEARLALVANPRTAAEWMTPVLYQQSAAPLSPMPWIVDTERARVRGFLERLVEEQFNRIQELFDRHGYTDGPVPAWPLDRRERAERLATLVAQQGETRWVRLQEEVLLAMPDFSPLQGSLTGWHQDPAGSWQLDGDELVSRAYAASAGPVLLDGLRLGAVLRWEGLRFRDGVLRAHLWLPTLAEGGGAGLLLRSIPGRGLVLGALHARPGSSPRIEIWQREGTGLVSLARREAPRELGDMDWLPLRFEIHERRAVLRLGEELVIEGRMSIDLPAGHLGLVHLGEGVVRVRELALETRRR